MTPEEQVAMSAYGEYIFGQAHQLIIALAGYGVFLLASFIALQFVPVFSLWSMIDECGISLTRVKLTVTLIENLNEGLAVQSQAAFTKTLPWVSTVNWPITINLLLSDFIVCWRAWILFGGQRIWKVILGILMGTNIGINVADLIWDDIHIIIFSGGGTGVLDWLSVATSLSVNLVATAMISYRAWIHHHIMAEASVTHRNHSVRLMLLLIESGAIYCTLQLLNMVFTILYATLPVEQTTSAQSLSYLLVNEIYLVISALYPVAVFVLIHTNNSPVVETFYFTQSRLEATNSIDMPLEEVSSSPPEVSNVVGGVMSGDREGPRIENTEVTV